MFSLFRDEKIGSEKNSGMPMIKLLGQCFSKCEILHQNYMDDSLKKQIPK